MRDHLLGCQAFMPPEDDGLTRCQKPYPLGVPEQVWDRHQARHGAAVKKAHDDFSALRDFETGDHTPEFMQKDFPKEYDFDAMLHDVMTSPAMAAYYAGLAVKQEKADDMLRHFGIDPGLGDDVTVVAQRQPKKLSDLADALSYGFGAQPVVNKTATEIMMRMRAVEEEFFLNNPFPPFCYRKW